MHVKKPVSPQESSPEAETNYFIRCPDIFDQPGYEGIGRLVRPHHHTKSLSILDSRLSRSQKVTDEGLYLFDQLLQAVPMRANFDIA